jgi:hypothetical protein
VPTYLLLLQVGRPSFPTIIVPLLQRMPRYRTLLSPRPGARRTPPSPRTNTSVHCGTSMSRRPSTTDTINTRSSPSAAASIGPDSARTLAGSRRGRGSCSSPRPRSPTDRDFQHPLEERTATATSLAAGGGGGSWIPGRWLVVPRGAP